MDVVCPGLHIPLTAQKIRLFWANDEFCCYSNAGGGLMPGSAGPMDNCLMMVSLSKVEKKQNDVSLKSG